MHPTPPLAAEFGATSTPVGPLPHAWAVAFDYRLSAFRTREIHVSEARRWAFALTLHEGGTVTARLRWKSSRHQSISHFASRDGEPHSEDRQDDGDQRLSGKWVALDPTSLEVRFDQVTDSVSSRGVELLLRCTAVASSHRATPLLACRIGSELNPLAELVTAHERSDDRRWLALTTENQPWIVLGAGLGLTIDWSVEREKDQLEVGLPAAPITEETLAR